MVHEEVLALIAQAKWEKSTELDLSRRNLNELPDEIGQLTGVRKLDLSHNALTTLPKSFGRLTELQSLDLDDNPLKSLPDCLGELRQLRKLYLSRNQLSALPDWLGALGRLQELYLSGNQLSVLPDWLDRWMELQSLYLGSNQLTALPESLGRLSQLRKLYLSNNGLGTLPEWLGGLARLQDLSLSSNQLTGLPESFDGLPQLGSLELNSNRLTALPESFGNLPQLQRLDLRDNQLAALPAPLGRLGKLRELYLSGNQLTGLPDSLGDLTELYYLDISRNRLAALPESLSRLGALQSLDLGSNRLTALPNALGRLRALKILDLHNNQLSALPDSLRRLERLQEIDLRGNPLPLPSEILDRWYEPQVIIRAWLEQKQPLNEIKLVLVGQGEVGKTSLVNRLLGRAFNPAEAKTEGVDIRRWPLAIFHPDLQEEIPVRVNVWDFGGQEIMHATHQFFLTRRTLYLLVIDARQDEAHNQLYYWLQIISSFSEGSPILIVGNKTDQHCLDLDRRGLQVKYPQIQGILETSCATGRGIEALRTAIKEQVARLPYVFDLLPKTWFDVKAQLETLGADYIPYDDYVQRCRRAGVEDARSQQILLDFLHDLGIVLHFSDPQLEPTNILNPEWVTQGVYRILNSPVLFEKQGMLTWELLRQILECERYPREMLMFIVALMRKFELCYPFDEENLTYLVPNLLPKDEPKTGEWEDALAFQFHYNVLPGSIMTRFIVRMYRLIHEHTVWRTGVLLACEGNEALIKADPGANEIYIRVRGPDAGRRDLLIRIRETLEAIHARMVGLQVKALVPIPGHPEVPPVDYRWLHELKRKGQNKFIPPGMTDFISVSWLLDGVDSGDDVGLEGEALDEGLRQLYKRLRRLNDTDLDQLCLFCLSKVYDKFSRGMPRDEKIILILDYCRRNPGALGQINEGLDEMDSG